MQNHHANVPYKEMIQKMSKNLQFQEMS